MELIFLRILSMNLSASIVIAIVLLARFCLRRAPKKWSYLLWGVAGFRLCCPISLKTVFSVFSFAPFSSTAAKSGQKIIIDYFPRDTASLVSPDIYYSGYESRQAAVQQAFPTTPNVSPAALMQTCLTAGTVLWCAGMAVLLVYGLVSYFRMRHRLADAVLVRDNIYETRCIRSPFILGLLWPKIYLPSGLDSDTLRYVLAHEQYHIKRKDYIVKAFAFLLLSVHWFNPLVWLAFHLMARDMEMSCDEAVLSKEAGAAKAYSMSLLSVATNRRFPTPSPLAFGETSVKSRIKNVLRWKKPKTWVTLAAMTFCVIVVAACGTNPKNVAKDTEPRLESDAAPVEEAGPDQARDPSPEPLRALTLEELVRMALGAEGDLRWEDFEDFSYRDESNPPFLRRRYEIDDVYSVLVSGSREEGEFLSGTPAYIYLYYGPYDCNRINVRWIGAGYMEADFAGLSEEEIAAFFVSEIRGAAEYVLPVDVIRGFPFLFVGDGNGSIEALTYCEEHYYDISAYTEYGNIGGGGTILNPLDERVHSLQPNVLRRAAGSSVYLLFDVDTVPDEVTVRCWPDDSWGDLENAGESVPVTYDTYFSFPLKDGSYIYDITASWDHRGLPENYWWTVHYIFIGDTAPNSNYGT